jgi:coenzyme F420-reducing hydrogenase alpha subunit
MSKRWGALLSLSKDPDNSTFDWESWFEAEHFESNSFYKESTNEPQGYRKYSAVTLITHLSQDPYLPRARVTASKLWVIMNINSTFQRGEKRAREVQTAYKHWWTVYSEPWLSVVIVYTRITHKSHDSVRHDSNITCVKLAMSVGYRQITLVCLF